jgi:hypothetical protein
MGFEVARRVVNPCLAGCRRRAPHDGIVPGQEQNRRPLSMSAPPRHLYGYTRPPTLGRASRLRFSAPVSMDASSGPLRRGWQVGWARRHRRRLSRRWGRAPPDASPRPTSSGSSLGAWGASTVICLTLADGPTARSKPTICSPQRQCRPPMPRAPRSPVRRLSQLASSLFPRVILDAAAVSGPQTRSSLRRHGGRCPKMTAAGDQARGGCEGV